MHSLKVRVGVIQEEKINIWGGNMRTCEEKLSYEHVTNSEWLLE